MVNAQDTLLWTYKAKIIRWIDGDTCDAQVDLGFRTYRTERFRLLGSTMGVDTPEKNSKDAAERSLAYQAMGMSASLAPPDGDVIIRTHRALSGDPRDGFGRYLAQVMLADGRNLGDVLIEAGLAKPYVRGA